MHLLSQTWTYGGVPIPVGQPELHRHADRAPGRRLVRAQFELLHRRSAERGIRCRSSPGSRGSIASSATSSRSSAGAGRWCTSTGCKPPEPAPGWRVRPAGLGDIAFLATAHGAAATRSLVSVPRDAALWRYELEGKRPGSAARREIRILERDGQPVGYSVHAVSLYGSGNLAVMAFEVSPACRGAKRGWCRCTALRGPARRWPPPAGRPLPRAQLLDSRLRASALPGVPFKEQDRTTPSTCACLISLASCAR